MSIFHPLDKDRKKDRITETKLVVGLQKTPTTPEQRLTFWLRGLKFTPTMIRHQMINALDWNWNPNQQSSAIIAKT